MKSAYEEDHHLFTSRIFHLMLEPQMTLSGTIEGCLLAQSTELAGVVVHPCYVREAGAVLKGSNLTLGTVIGFPYGTNTTYVKVAEAKRALTEGAQELIIAMNIGYILENREDLLLAELGYVSGLAHMNDARVQAFLDSQLLPEAQILSAARIAQEAQADFFTLGTKPETIDQQREEVEFVTKQGINGIKLGVLGEITLDEAVGTFVNIGCTRIGIKYAKKLH